MSTKIENWIAGALREAEALQCDELLWALRHLFRVAAARETPDVATLAVRRTGSQVELLINPAFMDEHIATPRDLLHVLAHEVLHKIRGDPRREIPPGATRFLMNIVCDMQVDASLRTIAFQEPPAYPAKLFRQGTLIDLFLTPPELLLGEPFKDLERLLLEPAAPARLDPVMEQGLAKLLEQTGGKLERAALAAKAQEASRIYFDAWWRRASTEDLLDRMVAFFADLERSSGAKLSLRLNRCDALGEGHPHDATADPWQDWPWDSEPMRKLRAKAGQGAGHGEDLADARTNRPPRERECWEVFEALRQALTFDPLHRRQSPALRPESGVVPHIGRREAFLLAAGYYPAFYRALMPAIDDDHRRVHLYVDVSGSVEPYLSDLFGLIAHLGDWLGPQVYAFSNEVVPLDLEAVRRGEYRTTWGTDFDCIARHALEHKFRRILVMTDGYASLDPDLAAALRADVEVFVLLTVCNPGSDIIRCAEAEHEPGRRSWQIPSLRVDGATDDLRRGQRYGRTRGTSSPPAGGSLRSIPEAPRALVWSTRPLRLGIGSLQPWPLRGTS